MPTVGSLIVNVLANTAPLTAGLTKAQAKIAAFAGGAMGATAATAGLAAAILKLHSANETIQRSMNNSLAIMGNVTKFQRDEMTRVAIETARVTIFSTSQVADGYYELASANMDAQQAMEAMPSVAAFAMAGNFNLATATKLAAGALYGLKLNSEDNHKQLKNLRMIMDKLVRVTTLAQTNTENFAEALTKSSGALRAAGMDIDDGLPILAAFARMNIEGAEAATALQIVLREFKYKAVENREEFEDFGVAVFDTSGNMRKVSAIFRDLTKAIGNFSTAEKVAAISAMGFQKKSLRFIELLSGQEEVMEEVEKKLKDYGGRMDEVAGRQMTSFQKAIKNLRAEWDLLSVSTSDASRFLERIVDWLAELIKWSNTVAEGGFLHQWFGDTTPMVLVLDAFHGMKVAVESAFFGIKMLLAGALAGVGKLMLEIYKVVERAEKFLQRMNPLNSLFPVGFGVESGTKEGIQEFIDKLNAERDAAGEALSDAWDSPPPSKEREQALREDTKVWERLQKKNQREALEGNLRRSGVGAWAGETGQRTPPGATWDMYDINGNVIPGGRSGAGLTNPWVKRRHALNPMTGTHDALWRTPAVEARPGESRKERDDRIKSNKEIADRQSRAQTHYDFTNWVNESIEESKKKKTPTFGGAQIDIASDAWRVDERAKDTTPMVQVGRENRVTKALELGTMEAFKAARGMGGADPQKEVATNTAGMWMTLKEIQQANADREPIEGGHITGMGGG